MGSSSRKLRIIGTVILLLAILFVIRKWTPPSHSARAGLPGKIALLPRHIPATEPGITENLPEVQSENRVQPAEPATPKTLQVYRVALDHGVVSLIGSTPIAGDFRIRRGPAAWVAGMWCMRTLDENMRVLAEETVPAPDHICVAQAEDGKRTPHPAAESAMTQFRMAPQPNAKWAKIYRLAGMERADWNTEPEGELLATIPLP